MEARLLVSEILGKFSILWSHLAAYIKDFHLHLVTTIYGDAISGSSKSECWMVVLTMVRVIWRYLRKVRFKSETAYGETYSYFMLVEYLWGILQAHQVMEYFV